MRRYETIFILDPDLSDEGRAPVVERLVQLIPQQGGMLVEEDHWGTRKLAYTIRKKPRGYYLRLDYCGVGTLVDELERFCRIDERVLKYMTVQLADNVDPDRIQAEMAERAAAKTAADAAGTGGGDSTAAPTEPSAPADDEDESDENPVQAENQNEEDKE